MRERLVLVKVACWDPDKRWLMALDAVCELKTRGLRPLLIARGGVEAHGVEVRTRTRALGLETSDIACDDETPAALCRALGSATLRDIVFIESTLSRAQLKCLYRAGDGVLANSGIEPFGLVGLESMACGGLSFVGATGEDYATPGHDAVSLQTSHPGELVSQLLYLREQPHRARRIRRAARVTAARYTWTKVIQTHFAPLLFSTHGRAAAPA